MLQLKSLMFFDMVHVLLSELDVRSCGSESQEIQVSAFFSIDDRRTK